MRYIELALGGRHVLASKYGNMIKIEVSCVGNACFDSRALKHGFVSLVSVSLGIEEKNHTNRIIEFVEENKEKLMALLG